MISASLIFSYLQSFVLHTVLKRQRLPPSRKKTKCKRKKPQTTYTANPKKTAAYLENDGIRLGLHSSSANILSIS